MFLSDLSVSIIFDHFSSTWCCLSQVSALDDKICTIQTQLTGPDWTEYKWYMLCCAENKMDMHKSVLNSAPGIKLFLTVIVGPRSADMCWSRFTPLSAPPDHDQLLRSKTSHDHAPPALMMIAWATRLIKYNSTTSHSHSWSSRLLWRQLIPLMCWIEFSYFVVARDNWGLTDTCTKDQFQIYWLVLNIPSFSRTLSLVTVTLLTTKYFMHTILQSVCRWWNTFKTRENYSAVKNWLWNKRLNSRFYYQSF